MDTEITLGLGGQGVLSMGLFLAYGGMSENKNVACVPALNTEICGRTISCTVTISDSEIICPLVSFPEIVVVMDHAGLERFEPLVRPGGLLLINETPGCRSPLRTDIKHYRIPAREIASRLGSPDNPNMIMLGALLKAADIINTANIHEYLLKTLADRDRDELAACLTAIEAGMDYMSKI